MVDGMTKEVLKMVDVQKIYRMGDRKLHALKDVDMCIRQNDFTTVLGKSGSGKSTLLHIMGLLDRPTKGRVYIDGIPTDTLTDDEQAKIRGKKIGFVFQTFNLINSITALENVELPMVIYDVPKEERTKRATSLLEKLGMGHRLDHYPGQLSGGERQRVAIARALSNDPEIILADEPTGNLDSKTGKEVLKIFKKLQENEKRTVVIITHDISITKITKKTVKLMDGKIVGEMCKTKEVKKK